MIYISIDHETCLAVFYATILYYFFYLRVSDGDKYYTIEVFSPKQKENLEASVLPMDEEVSYGDLYDD